MLTYKVIKPSIATPGATIRVRPHPLKATNGAEQMVFKAIITNAGTDRIERPSKNDGFVIIGCPLGWELVSTDYKDSNGIL